MLGNIIRYNTALGAFDEDSELGGFGGGLQIETHADPAQVADNVIYGNNARFLGGGILVMADDSHVSPQQIVNNTVYGNIAQGGAELATTGYGKRITVANNMLGSATVENAVDCDPSVSPDSPAFINNDIHTANGAPTLGTCVSTVTGGSNLSVDPLFAGGKPHIPCKLAPDSPLIDAGSNAYVGGQKKDFLGDPRVVDGGRGSIVDIGACEYDPASDRPGLVH